MRHLAIDRVIERIEIARMDSDFTYFFSLLLAGEALFKTVVLGMISAIEDDVDRNRYRLEHQIVRASGIGDWSKSLDDALSGTASQFLLMDARHEQSQLNRLTKDNDWQYESLKSLKAVLDHIGVTSEELPVKSDMKRWFRLFATLRNKTRGHGAIKTEKTGQAAEKLRHSIDIFYNNFSLFERPWAYLHRNLSGKYRLTPITRDGSSFDLDKKHSDLSIPNGIYLFWNKKCPVPLMRSDSDLQDFYFANGGLTGNGFELLSYRTDDRITGEASMYRTPPGTLPKSETEGHGELLPCGNCFSNAPNLIEGYIPRPQLEKDLKELLMDDKRPIVTLVGRGGIGKTSLALKVVKLLYDEERYEAIVWLSARDVDLQLSGPKPVRPKVISPEDMGKYYANLVLSTKTIDKKSFNARSHFEKQLQECEMGKCLFIFDNFETTQNPVEMFNWIDSFVRLPNKVLITTRLRDFKGDYPVEVKGMDNSEAKKLVDHTAATLNISDLLCDDYVDQLISKSEGHPYVIKILLGDVSRAGMAIHIPKILAGSDDILTALFERTYASLKPCAQRAFLTLSAWSSSVPRLALEAVLIRSTTERCEVEEGIESLLQFSMADMQVAAADKQEFIGLPLVSSIFGRKKLNVSPIKDLVKADVEILQMLGPSKFTDVNLGLAKRLERFIANIARRVDAGATFEQYSAILDMICRSYSPGWFLIARWHYERFPIPDYEKSKEASRRFLEENPDSISAADAWRLLGMACFKSGDLLGGIHAFIERAQISTVEYSDVSNTANRLNALLKDHGLEVEREQKQALAERLLQVMVRRSDEANADDYSRMAWLALHLGNKDNSIEYAQKGLLLDPDNLHCLNLIEI